MWDAERLERTGAREVLSSVGGMKCVILLVGFSGRDLLGFRRKSSENFDLELSLLHIHIHVYSTFHIESNQSTKEIPFMPNQLCIPQNFSAPNVPCPSSFQRSSNAVNRTNPSSPSASVF